MDLYVIGVKFPSTVGLQKCGTLDVEQSVISLVYDVDDITFCMEWHLCYDTMIPLLVL